MNAKPMIIKIDALVNQKPSDESKCEKKQISKAWLTITKEIP